MLIVVIRGLAKLVRSCHGGSIFNGEDEIEDAFDTRLVAVEGGDLLAARHHQNAIRMLDDFFQIGRDQNDAHTLIAEAANGLENLLLGAEVDAAGRLVEQKHARPPMHAGIERPATPSLGTSLASVSPAKRAALRTRE